MSMVGKSVDEIGRKYIVKTPIIETERMILRPLSITDAKDIYERWTSDDRVSKYVRWWHQF